MADEDDDLCEEEFCALQAIEFRDLARLYAAAGLAAEAEIFSLRALSWDPPWGSA